MRSVSHRRRPDRSSGGPALLLSPSYAKWQILQSADDDVDGDVDLRHRCIDAFIFLLLLSAAAAAADVDDDDDDYNGEARTTISPTAHIGNGFGCFSKFCFYRLLQHLPDTTKHSC